MPLVHARDAALGKVAAIGTVNPRPGGPINSLVQAWKRFVARVLDWHVREQVEFNRKSVACVDAAIEAFNEINRALVALGIRFPRRSRSASELTDIRNHWADWRVDWETKLAQNEMQFLRSVADLQAGFQHRSDLMDASHRELMRAQHRISKARWSGSRCDIQKRLWADLERIRLEYERLIHSELKTIRQRARRCRAGSRDRRRRDRARRRRRNWGSTTAASPSASAAPRSTSKMTVEVRRFIDGSTSAAIGKSGRRE